MKKFILFISIIFSVLSKSYGQCAMCKAVVENGDSGLAEGLNDGIVTLMIVPYILVTIIALIFWRNYKKNN